MVIGLVWVQWVAPAGSLCTFVQPSFFQASYSFYSDIPERKIEDSFLILVPEFSLALSYIPMIDKPQIIQMLLTSLIGKSGLSVDQFSAQ